MISMCLQLCAEHISLVSAMQVALVAMFILVHVDAQESLTFNDEGDGFELDLLCNMDVDETGALPFNLAIHKEGVDQPLVALYDSVLIQKWESRNQPYEIFTNPEWCNYYECRAWEIDNYGGKKVKGLRISQDHPVPAKYKGSYRCVLVVDCNSSSQKMAALETQKPEYKKTIEGDESANNFRKEKNEMLSELHECSVKKTLKPDGVLYDFPKVSQVFCKFPS